MNYPVWEISVFGGGFLIALIATIHVYVAHFAVGGGLFLVVTEMKARRDGDSVMLEYVHTHTRFFLLLTMVFGALTGFGIWLTISILNPGATSIMIHTFVFGWATEWVFFLVEIVSLLIYYYTFDRLKASAHVRIGWIYFVAAWLSLFMIDGIISFMLTPGSWLETGNFWDAFFNPSFLPSLLFRTAFALILAGVYGLITSTNLKDPAFRQKMVRYCVLWLVIPFILLIPTGFWYLQAIPEAAKEMITGGSPHILSIFKSFLVITPIVFLLGLIMAFKMPKGLQRGFSFVILIVAFLCMGSFEMVRESGRRPYIIYGHMYSNSIPVSMVSEVKAQGVLKSAKWTENKVITEGNRMQAGRELYNILCLSCHSIGGFRNDIKEKTQGMSTEKLAKVLNEMGRSKAHMPAFPGTNLERQTLISYITEGLPAH